MFSGLRLFVFVYMSANKKGISSLPCMFFKQVYNNYGGALHAVSRYDEAIQKFDKVVHGFGFRVYIRRGNTEIRQGSPWFWV